MVYGGVHRFIGIVLLYQVLVNYWMAALIDPGYIKKGPDRTDYDPDPEDGRGFRHLSREEAEAWVAAQLSGSGHGAHLNIAQANSKCPRCELSHRSPRAHHCKMCRRCVDRYEEKKRVRTLQVRTLFALLTVN